MRNGFFVEILKIVGCMQKLVSWNKYRQKRTIEVLLLVQLSIQLKRFWYRWMKRMFIESHNLFKTFNGIYVWFIWEISKIIIEPLFVLFYMQCMLLRNVSWKEDFKHQGKACINLWNTMNIWWVFPHLYWILVFIELRFANFNLLTLRH